MKNREEFTRQLAISIKSMAELNLINYSKLLEMMDRLTLERRSSTQWNSPINKLSSIRQEADKLDSSREKFKFVKNKGDHFEITTDIHPNLTYTIEKYQVKTPEDAQRWLSHMEEKRWFSDYHYAALNDLFKQNLEEYDS